MIQNEKIAAEIAAANEDALTALANKGLYKRALKDTEGLSAEYTEADGTVLITVGGEQCTIRSPLEKSSCSCPSRTVCRHILGAVLLLKKEVPEAAAASAAAEIPTQVTVASVVEEQVPEAGSDEEVLADTLTAAEVNEVRECVGQSLSLLGGLLARGLVRADTSAAEAAELAALQAHAAKMADAEKKLRAISGRLSDCISRRASFDARNFTRLLCGCASLLTSLDRDDITRDELGVFRDTYEQYPGRLELLPIGQKEVRSGEYTGSVYYFLNIDEKAQERILTYSDLRPAFYVSGKRQRRPQTTVWNAGAPLARLMHFRLTLDKAKTSGDKLSGSSETEIVSQSRAELDCPEFRRLIVTDHRELACKLKADEPGLFLIRIYELADFGFDKYTQTFKMDISDRGGRAVTAEVRYSAENKETVETLEKICRRIKGTVDVWTMLASARNTDGRVVLEPIEFYDFIDSRDFHSFVPPDEEYGDPAYAQVLLRLVSETEDGLVRMVRSGLSSSQEDHSPLIGRISRCGMSGLAELAKECFGSAGAYRHDLGSGGTDTLIRAAALMRYINNARNKLGRISALYDMEKQNNKEEQ